MPMVSNQLRPVNRSSVPFGAGGLATFDEAAITPTASPVNSDRRSLEEQRERALREFKRIWNICALPQ